MNKLTLGVDKAVIEKAKRIAEANHTSVSAMFSQFVQSMASPRRRAEKIGPLTRKLSGIVKLSPNKSYRRLLTEALMEKYGMTK